MQIFTVSWILPLCCRSCQEAEEQLHHLLSSTKNMSLPAPSISNLNRRPQCTTNTAIRSRKLTYHVRAASSTCTSPQDVQKLWQLAGRKYGHDLSGEGRQQVETHLNNIQQGVQQLDLTGTSWKLAYTTSQGQSGGRVGPFIGYVTQVSVMQCSSPFWLAHLAVQHADVLPAVQAFVVQTCWDAPRW